MKEKKLELITKMFDGKHYVELYLPARTGVVLKELVILPSDIEEK